LSQGSLAKDASNVSRSKSSKKDLKLYVVCDAFKVDKKQTSGLELYRNANLPFLLSSNVLPKKQAARKNKRVHPKNILESGKDYCDMKLPSCRYVARTSK